MHRLCSICFFIVVLSPAIASAQCMYAVAPAATLAQDGPPDLASGHPELQAHWQVNCTGACDANWDEQTNVAPYYAAATTVQADPGCYYPGSRMDQGTCAVAVLGKKVVARFINLRCGTVMYPDSLMLGTSAAYAVPAYMPALSQLAVLPNPLNTDPHYGGDPSQIPVGMPFRIAGPSVTPYPPESATFRVEGAGISFTKTYPGRLMGGANNPQDVGADWSQDPDVSTYVTATQPGGIQFWVEFEGTKSDVRTLTAVAVNGGSGGGGGSSSGGGSGGAGGSAGGSMPKQGCGAFDGSLSLAIASVGAAFARRRRR